MVKVLRPFHDGPSNRFVLPGDDVDPTPGRHDELAANGLVEPRGTAAKMKAVPQNKMDEVPANKAEPAPSVAVKRGPGRPMKAR